MHFPSKKQALALSCTLLCISLDRGFRVVVSRTGLAVVVGPLLVTCCSRSVSLHKPEKKHSFTLCLSFSWMSFSLCLAIGIAVVVVGVVVVFTASVSAMLLLLLSISF